MSMTALTEERSETENTAPASLKRMLVALDASEHANRALEESIRLAVAGGGHVTGIHAYAAQLHDRRFKMMEGGLPERYHEEEEMEYQRVVHDSLITKGLGIITDSYHDVGLERCQQADVEFRRLSPEGKNYSQIVDATRTGEHDVLVLGALGLGAGPGSLVGTVCERVTRRSAIDTLVIRDTDRAIGDGPIVVGIDGSELSNGALMTALDVAERLGAEVHAVAAYDPYYHYVAFNKIAGVLSEEAGKVFRFKEQEQLHEELIDDGIAKIYQSHLEVARSIAEDLGVKLKTTLLDGKPWVAILKYLDSVNASMIIVGKTGVHADDDLDIGGTSENLLRQVSCHVWLTQTSYIPPFEVVAEETVTWSVEAEKKLSRAPEFVRDMARRMVLRHAQKLGHTFITSDVVDEVMKSMMPGFGDDASKAARDRTVAWSDDASKLIDDIQDKAVADNIRLRAVKRARRDQADEVGVRHVTPFLDLVDATALTWSAAALARVARVPEMVRDTVKLEIEDLARQREQDPVSLELAEEVILEVRKNMCPVPEQGADGG
ncbi:MAG: universal stress protein [Alphaproteobacteria bacterium]|mgnify:CR=1 FL=1|jgi:nucleotide-binding universal stress UspA family protein|nr:universal stress protein [Alphaproteobacteria bacterium]MBT4084233.1 universal stress protein [Alphaproteobacteria bacterium]MBT4543572.1 universal stress protein [Alphaproteobacteria bacterium]MBT5919129.1 universal stress protein [Alphaproteobacteria bacterium]MBT7745702.1 universal stress protein [Alphaproteobacteria bacterium]